MFPIINNPVVVAAAKKKEKEEKEKKEKEKKGEEEGKGTKRGFRPPFLTLAFPSKSGNKKMTTPQPWAAQDWPMSHPANPRRLSRRLTRLEREDAARKEENVLKKFGSKWEVPSFNETERCEEEAGKVKFEKDVGEYRGYPGLRNFGRNWDVGLDKELEGKEEECGEYYGNYKKEGKYYGMESGSSDDSGYLGGCEDNSQEKWKGKKGEKK
ncbi:hypothetical protein QBC43DRAFT_333744 [Cladorrhinum sp. PSN259]|nr:hypothetical protein QBC43DRAFT_333744 [Cladorrhinum sp. PSN259]